MTTYAKLLQIGAKFVYKVHWFLLLEIGARVIASGGGICYYKSGQSGKIGAIITSTCAA